MIKMLQYKMYPAGELRCPTTALVFEIGKKAGEKAEDHMLLFILLPFFFLFFFSINCYALENILHFTLVIIFLLYSVLLFKLFR